MQFFSKSHSALGVDIGTTSIKIVELEPGGERPRLVNYAILETYDYLERFNEALQTSTLRLSEANIAGFIKIMLKEAGFKANRACVSISSFNAFSTLVEAPSMSDSEARKFIELQAKQYIPIPLDSAVLDWSKVGEINDEAGTQKSQLFLAAIPKDQIVKYQNIFKAAGLKLNSLEIEGMSLARALELDTRETTALAIDIGSRSTGIFIVRGGFLKFSSQTDFAGSSVTQNIAKGLNIAVRRAEDLKKQRGLAGFGGEHELSTIITPVLDVIIYEAKRVVVSFETSYREKIGAVILAGGGANLIGLADYMKTRFNLPVSIAKPFTAISYPQAFDALAKDLGPVLAPAIGLAMKGLS